MQASLNFMRPMLIAIVAAAAALPAIAGPAVPPNQIDSLFKALHQAGSPEEAKPIEDQINILFLQSGSPSVDLLMTRASVALAAGDKDAARKLIQAVTDIAPNYAEGWHHRAELEAEANQDESAMISLGHVITINPREFSAMNELATMLEDYGDKAAALKLYKKALALDPQLDGADRHEKALEREVEGQGI
jgi:tetratricopeptide (TPR) repeat protein